MRPGREVEVKKVGREMPALGQVVNRDLGNDRSRTAAQPFSESPARDRRPTGATTGDHGRRGRDRESGTSHGVTLHACRTSRHSVDLLDTLLIPLVQMIEHLDVVIVALASPASAPPGTCRTGVPPRATRSSSPDNLGGTWTCSSTGHPVGLGHVHAGFRFKPWTSEKPSPTVRRSCRT